MGQGPSAALCAGDPAFVKHTERGSAVDAAKENLNIHFAVSEMQGQRSTMEDQHILGASLGEGHSVFAVFDGHGGNFASEYVRDNCLAVLNKRPELAKYWQLTPEQRADTNGVTLLRQALTTTFYLLDAMLIPLQKERDAFIKRQQRHESLPDLSEASDSDEDGDADATPSSSSSELPYDEKRTIPGERSGSTGVLVLLTPAHVICANTGDSRALLRRDGKFLPLSFDHKPNAVAERTRIASAGGVVKSKRIDGDLAVSRAFGDFAFKADESLDPSAQKVTVAPDFVVYPRRLAGDEFIVLACDGVWDVAESSETAQFVQTMLGEGETDLGNICEEALDICLERNSRDNMTFMIIGLPAMKVNRSRSAVARNALWGTRTARKTKAVHDQSAHVAKSGIRALGKEIGIEEQNCECVQD